MVSKWLIFHNDQSRESFAVMERGFLQAVNPGQEVTMDFYFPLKYCTQRTAENWQSQPFLSPTNYVKWLKYIITICGPLHWLGTCMTATKNILTVRLKRDNSIIAATCSVMDQTLAYIRIQHIELLQPVRKLALVHTAQQLQQCPTQHPGQWSCVTGVIKSLHITQLLTGRTSPTHHVIVNLVTLHPLPSIRQHFSYDDCPTDKREDYQNCSVLYCVAQLCTIICTLMSAVVTDELSKV